MTGNEIQIAGTEGNAALGLRVAMDRNPCSVYLARMTKASRRVIQSRLRRVADLVGWPSPFDLPWGGMKYQHVAAIRTMLQDQKLARATVNSCLSAIRGVCREAWRLDQMNEDDLARIEDLKGVKGTTLSAAVGRALPSEEIAALMTSCAGDDTARGRRDAALFAVLYVGGVRRDELANLDLEDYNLESGQLIVRSGKGNKARTVYIGNGAGAAMRDWIAVRGNTPGPLFHAVNKGGKITPGRMTGQAVYLIMIRRGEAAGIASFRPHDVRRSFISDLLDAGVDISTVAQLAGHSSVTTTARYDRRGEAVKAKAAGMLKLPYVARAHRQDAASWTGSK